MNLLGSLGLGPLALLDLNRRLGHVDPLREESVEGLRPRSSLAFEGLELHGVVNLLLPLGGVEGPDHGKVKLAHADLDLVLPL